MRTQAAHIRWEKIAAEMRQEHRLAISPRDAQALWKFLAYGKQPRAKTSGGDDELLAASDSEDLGLSAQSINAKTRAAAAAPPDSAKAAADPAPPGAAAAQLRLYPSYELPSGLPETWQKPFNVKATLPLTFVAEKLLKDKPGAPPALLAAAGGVTGALTAMSPGTNGAAAANGAPVVEKKRGRKPGPKPKTLVDVEAAKKQRVMAQPKPPAVAAGTPRAAYTPSPTPPAQPVLPRSAFQFFCRMYEVNPKIVEAQPTPVAAAAPATAGPAGAPVKTAAAATPAAVPAKKTYSELQALFSGSPLYVRSQCQKYALEDLDRYNHECVRRRIWEKAMASQRNSPAPSPLPARAADPQPRPPPVAAAPTTHPRPASVAASVATPAAAAPPAPTPTADVKGAQ